MGVVFDLGGVYIQWVLCLTCVGSIFSGCCVLPVWGLYSVGVVFYLRGVYIQWVLCFTCVGSIFSGCCVLPAWGLYSVGVVFYLRGVYIQPLDVVAHEPAERPKGRDHAERGQRAEVLAQLKQEPLVVGLLGRHANWERDR